MNVNGVEFGWLSLGLALVIAALLVWLAGRALRASSGLPAGQVIYSDMGTWYPQARPLYSQTMQLVGRPDYLVRETSGMLIPVELKSNTAPAEPHEGHILQLAAYCLLVEEVYGVRPDYGILQYRDKAFAIDYTIELEEDLLDLLASMREDIFEPDVDRDHSDWRRCARCGLRSHCYQRLA